MLKDKGTARIHKKMNFDPRVVRLKNTAEITQNDLDILTEATNGNCGLVLLMRKHNINAILDLVNIVHKETVDT